MVVRPIAIILTHPSVSPYVARVEPHVHYAMETVTPVVLRTHAKWSAGILSQWNNRVIPQWDRFATPYIHRVGKKAYPYCARIAQEYNNRIFPSVEIAVHNLRYRRRNAQAYLFLLASKTYDGYQSAKPYAIPVLHQTEVALSRLLLVLQSQRRHFVDPHVAKIWEKVKELSSGKQTKGSYSAVKSTHSLGSSTPTAPEFVAVSETTPFVIESTTPSHIPTAQTRAEEPIVPSTAVLPVLLPPSDQKISTAGSTSIFAGHSVHEPLAVSDTNTVESTNSDPVVPTDIPVTTSVLETVEPTASLISASVHDFPPAYPDVTSPANEIFSSAASAAATPSTQPEIDHIDQDLHNFVADLGLDDDFPHGSKTESSVPDHPKATETEEDAVERLRRQAEETAKKRADIMGRHAKWEEQLEDQIQSQQQQLRKSLVAVRKAAVVELKGSVKINGQVEFLVKEAEKYLKGAEVYLASLKKETMREDRTSLWNRVVQKVDEKFAERMRETEAVVNEWYNELLQREIREVRRFSYFPSLTEMLNFPDRFSTLSSRLRNLQSGLKLTWVWIMLGSTT